MGIKRLILALCFVALSARAQNPGVSSIPWGACNTSGCTMTGALTLTAGTGSGTMRPAGTLYIATTDVGTLADLNPLDLFSYTVPANTLARTGDRLICYFDAQVGANVNTKTTQVFVNGNNVANRTAADNGTFIQYKIEVVRTGATTSDTFRFSEQGTALSTYVDTTAWSITFASPFIVKLVGQNGTAAANDVLGTMARCELWPAP